MDPSTWEVGEGVVANKERRCNVAKTKLVALVVTTAHRGVFFGYAELTDKKTIRLTRARMCVYWSTDVRSVLGLAAGGPTQDCKIGPAVPAITLHDVTSVLEVSPEAVKKWEQGPWA